MCGIELHVDRSDAVTLIRPTSDDVWSKGYICPERTALRHLHADPDRLHRLGPGHFVDVLSGNAAVNGIPVEVAAAG
jgi:hypothetical protein